MKTFKQVLLDRIEVIKNDPQNNGWNKGAMRWRDFKITAGIAQLPIQDVSFKELSNDDLIKAFERIIRRHNSQM